MINYTTLHENVDAWYDSITWCMDHPECENANRYFYAYLSCMEEFSHDLV